MKRSNHLPCSSHVLVHPACVNREKGTRGTRVKQRLASLAWAGCLALTVGCGAEVQQGETPQSETAQTETAQAATPRESEATPPAVNNPPAQPQAQKPAPPAIKPVVPPPTADQIKRWSVAPFEPLQLLAIREWEKTSFTAQLAAAPDGEHFIVAGSRVLLWSLTGDEPEHLFLDVNASAEDSELLSLAVSPDGKWFAVGDSTGTVRVWGLEDRQEIASKKLDQTGIQSLAISPDAKEIAIISYDSEVTTWSADELAPLKTFKVDTNSVKRVAYLAPNMLAVAGETTSLWNTSTGELAEVLSPGRYSFALARSPDDSRFIFGGNDKLHLWNIADAKQEAEITQGVSGSELLAFSANGQWLATTNGRSVQVWNLAERRVVQVLDGFGWAVTGLSWLPKSDLLAVASESGCTRIWGTAAQGEAYGLSPLHMPIAMPAANAKAPSTPAQQAQIIDLRTFPQLPGCEPTMVSQFDYSCTTKLGSAEIQTFYHYFLEKAGWSESTTPADNPMAVDYRKDGYKLSINSYDAGDGTTNLSLHCASNYDLRWTPKFDAEPTESVYEFENTVAYRTKADLLRIETELLKKLHANGWTAYTRLNSSHSEQLDARDLNFIRNGTTLRVSIGRFPNDPTSYTIQYSLFPNESSVPLPADVGFAEFSGSTDPKLVAITTMTLAETSQFYDKNLASDGWLVRQHGRAQKDDYQWLTYIRGQSNLTIGLTKLPDGRTLIQCGEVNGSLWESSQAKVEPSDEPADEAAAIGLEAADFPALKGAKATMHDANEKRIEVEMEQTTLADVAEQFIAALTALGWTVEEGGIRDKDYTLITFTKDDKDITLRARQKDGNAVISFEGDGLLWNKELPGGKQIVSYEAWLRQNQLPPGLELLDRYEAEMRAIKPTQAAGVEAE